MLSVSSGSRLCLVAFVRFRLMMATNAPPQKDNPNAPTWASPDANNVAGLPNAGNLPAPLVSTKTACMRLMLLSLFSNQQN